LVGIKPTAKRKGVEPNLLIVYFLVGIKPTAKRKGVEPRREIRTHDLWDRRKVCYHCTTSGSYAYLRMLVIYSLKTPWLRLHFIAEMVHLSLFNSELKLAFGFSLSYELQIWCFYFLIFSKIMIFHFVVLFCRSVIVSLILFTWLLFMHLCRECK
jgi:hypothetical protein